jgi:hypothetical protein
MAEAAEHFPIYYPGAARPTLGGEGHFRRLAKLAGVAANARVLHLGADPAVVSDLVGTGCKLLVASPSEQALDALRESARGSFALDGAELRRIDLRALGFHPGEFDAVVLDARAPMSLERIASLLRPFLAKDGRLWMSYPVKVGRHPHPGALALWGKRLGEPLRLPREALQVLEQHGFEPLASEALADARLDEFYLQVEQDLEPLGVEDPRAKLIREEIALHRSQGGRAGVAYAVLIARRREPDEKPGPARAE